MILLKSRSQGGCLRQSKQPANVSCATQHPQWGRPAPLIGLRSRPLQQIQPGSAVSSRRRLIARLSPFEQAWGPQIDQQSLAAQLFAASLFPYLAFLFCLTISGKAPRLMLFGFYFLLAFVGATIPAGIYAKSHYGTSLANVDWLHGSAESLLTITNLFIVLGLRQAIRDAQTRQQHAESSGPQEAADGTAVVPGSPASTTAPRSEVKQ